MKRLVKASKQKVCSTQVDSAKSRSKKAVEAFKNKYPKAYEVLGQ